MTGLPPITDEELIAYLDGELPLERRQAIGAEIVRNGHLRRRLSAFDCDIGALKIAFDALANSAPAAEIGTRLDRGLGQGQFQRRAFLRWSAIAAFFLAGAGAGYIGGRYSGGEIYPDWHKAVADYQALYITETLSAIPEDMESRRREVTEAAARIGLPLQLETVQLPEFHLKRVQLLKFEGKPLVQFAYLGPQGIPVALCAIWIGRADSTLQVETFHGLPGAVWNKGGYGFIFIGAVPIEALRHAAALLEQRIGGLRLTDGLPGKKLENDGSEPPKPIKSIDNVILP